LVGTELRSLCHAGLVAFPASQNAREYAPHG
jgi:hypothetical protein